MDIYQPYGEAPELLFDGDWDGLTPWKKHEVRIKSLPKYIDPVRTGLTGMPETAQFDDLDSCDKTGSLFAWVGTSIADKDGNGSLRSISEQDMCLEDFIGHAIEIRGAYSHFDSSYPILACGNVVEVPCPQRPRTYW